MSELRLINKTTCDFVYADKAVQLSKYALYLTEGRFVGQFQFINLIKEENITEVTLKIAAYDSFERLVSEFECTIHRSNNLDSNEKFGDNSPIYIKGQDIGKIVPEIVSYSTADKTVDYSDSTKINLNRNKRVDDLFDLPEIELINKKFGYNLRSDSVLPQKIAEGMYMDIDGEVKHYEGTYLYGEMYTFSRTDQFENDTIELENSPAYMTKHLYTTLTDSEKRSKYFKMFKTNKVMRRNLIIIIIAIILVLSGGIVAKTRYDAHKYNGTWELLYEGRNLGHVDIDGEDVTEYVVLIHQSDVDEDLYTFINSGKRKGNKITYTKLKYMPVHDYDEEYSKDDYVEEDINVVSKIKRISKNKIKIGKDIYTKKE